MATISFERPVKVNPDWGVDNLVKAVEKGSFFDRYPKEKLEKARASFKTEMTPTEKARFREKHGLNKQ